MADVGGLGWPASTHLSGVPNGQASLFAVATGGKAVGTPDGLGAMTSHLLAALADDGPAVDWSDDTGEYVISMNSLRDAVRAGVDSAVAGFPLWQRQYMLPQLELLDPMVRPLRTVADPPLRKLVLTVIPPAAAAQTQVALAQRRRELAAPQWPPERIGEEVLVDPQRYEVIAHSPLGPATPDPLRVDVRRQSSVVIHVAIPPGSGAPPDADPRLVDAARSVAAERLQVSVDDLLLDPISEQFQVSGAAANGVSWHDAVAELSTPPPPTPPESALVQAMEPLEQAARDTALQSHLTAQALEPRTMVEVAGIGPPYVRLEQPGTVRAVLTAGLYRVRFRAGPDVFAETIVDLGPGDNLRVTPTVGQSRLLQSLLGDEAAAGDVVLSEAIGPMQSAVVDTLLPIVGLKPFDLGNVLFHRFSDLVPPLEPGALAPGRPVSVVLALEGDGWPGPPEDVLSAAEAGLTGTARAALIERRPLRPLGERLTMWVGSSLSATFSVTLNSPVIGTLTLPSAALPGRVTVLSVIVRSDGSFTISQNLLRLPEPIDSTTGVPYGQLLRHLQLGQRLYASGELVTTTEASLAPPFGPDLLKELLYAKWTDPILGCMAYDAWSDAIARGDLMPDAALLRGETARNLITAFPELPDASVIAAVEWPAERPIRLGPLLDQDIVPLLAANVRRLAAFARATGRPDAAVCTWENGLSLATPWAANWRDAATIPTPGPAPISTRVATSG